MARLPDLAAEGRFAAPQPSLGVVGYQPTGGRYLQQTGQAVTAAGRQLEEMATVIAETNAKQDEIVAQDAVNRLQEQRVRLQVDEDGFGNKRGRDALGGKFVDDWVQRFTDAREGIARDLSPAQRALFERRSQPVRLHYIGDLLKHQSVETDKFNTTVEDAQIDSARRDMVANYADPVATAANATQIRAVIEQRAKRQGWDQKLRDEALLLVMSPVHAATMDAMMDAGRSDDARAYFQANGAQMTLKDRARMQDAIQTAQRVEKSQRALDDMAARGLDTKAMLAEARAKFIGPERDDLERRIEHRANVEAAVNAKAVRALTDQAWTEAQATGRIAPSTLSALRQVQGGQEIAQIENFLDARMRRAKADAEGKFTTDMPTYLRLMDMAANERTAFSQLDLERFRPYLTDADLKHFAGIKAGIDRGDAKQMESLRVVKSTVDALKYDILQAGIDLTPKEGDKAAIERAQRFNYALTTALTEATQAKGSPLTAEEAKRIGLSMVREGIEQGSGVLGFLQTRRRGYEIATDPNIKPGASFVAARFGDIPADVRNALTAEYRQRNPRLGTRPLDSEAQAAIERAYTRGIQEGRFRAPGR